jgi:hypothetical protein
VFYCRYRLSSNVRRRKAAFTLGHLT